MHYTMYTTKEKLAHLDKAKVAMENGTGSFRSYAKENGISRSTFYKWAHTHGYCENCEQDKPSTPFVNLDKQPEQQEFESQKLVVSGFGAAAGAEGAQGLHIVRLLYRGIQSMIIWCVAVENVGTGSSEPAQTVRSGSISF